MGEQALKLCEAYAKKKNEKRWDTLIREQTDSEINKMYRAGEGSILATKIEADDSRREGTGHFDKKTPLNGKKKPGTKVSAKSLNAIDSLTFQQDNELKRPRSDTNEICGASIEENKAR